MAKKKAKKKTSKKKKKTKRKIAKKAPLLMPLDRALKARLAKKVMAVAGEWEGFEATGKGVDVSPGKEEGSEFAYTRSEVVFKKYAELCRTNGLWWRPISAKLTVHYRTVWAECDFELVDVDTGFAVTFSGIGQGNNGVWAVNSAQTVALKQALLELFMAYWTAPEDPAREKVDYFAAFKAITSPADLIMEMQALLDKNSEIIKTKGKKDGNSNRTNESSGQSAKGKRK